MQPSVIVKTAFDQEMAELIKKKEKEKKKAIEKKKKEDAKFKIVTKDDNGEIEKILGQDPMHVYIGGGILLLLILGAALKRK